MNKPLSDYAQNRFARLKVPEPNTFLAQWQPIIQAVQLLGAPAAIKQHLHADISYQDPQSLQLALYDSVAGQIPIISAGNVDDFERLVCTIIHKGKPVANIAEMGASFVFGKTNRFIILSSKPYSNVAAHRMGLSDDRWCELSLILRRDHECAHYYSKRFYGSSSNNLHDELIADFNGLFSAFGEYKAEWFLKFLGLSDDSDGVHGRLKLYTVGMSESDTAAVAEIARIASHFIESWTHSSEFKSLDEAGRIDYLCETDLLDMKL